jgi:hypothetical protein
MRNKETWVLVLINLYEVETVLKGHIACFVDVILEFLVGYPRLLPFRIFIYSNIKEPVDRDWFNRVRFNSTALWIGKVDNDI